MILHTAQNFKFKIVGLVFCFSRFLQGQRHFRADLLQKFCTSPFNQNIFPVLASFSPKFLAKVCAVCGEPFCRNKTEQGRVCKHVPARFIRLASESAQPNSPLLRQGLRSRHQAPGGQAGGAQRLLIGALVPCRAPRHRPARHAPQARPRSGRCGRLPRRSAPPDCSQRRL